MITSRRLTAVLTRTLEAKAEQAMAAETPARTISPTRRTSSVSSSASVPASDEAELAGLLDRVHLYSEPSPLRVVDGLATAGRRRRFLPAVALVAVLAFLAAGVTALSDRSSEDPASIKTLGDPPDGWLVPGWVPDGMELWGIDSGVFPGYESSAEPTTIPQLFGDPDGGRAIHITSFQYEVVADTAEPVTVRGQAGRAGRSWDVEEADAGDAVTWDERGTSLTARYKGTSRADAIATLNSLEWRSDDPADGFAPPADDSWALRGEVTGWPPAGRYTTFAYSRGVPSSNPADGRLGLRIHTESSSWGSAAHLAGWYEQGSETGGAEGPVSSFDEEKHVLTVSWPDGRSIYIEPRRARAELPSRQTLERIARSMTVATGADLDARRETVGANIEALPVVASGETRIGTVELHGESGFLQMCLNRSAEQRVSCRTDALAASAATDGSATTTAEWMVDGRWYVVVASRNDEFQIVGGGDATRAPDAGELPAEVTTAGEWTLRLVEPPPDIEEVCLRLAGGAVCVHHRPA